MSESGLKRLRPGVRWNSSIEAYVEQIEACQPFFETATYVFTKRHGLTAINLQGEWDVSSPSEIEATIPGFLFSCRSQWGEPQGVEVFTRPKGGSVAAWNVGLWWTPTWGEIYAFYTSPVALAPRGNEFTAGYYVQLSPQVIAAFREWAKGDTRAESIAVHFHGFPTGDQVPEATFE